VAPLPVDLAFLSADTRELVALLHKHAVRYLLVGGGAVIYYGFPRLTGDMDFFYDAHPDNVILLYRALDDFWGGNIPGLERAEELTNPDLVLQFGVPPNRIDLISQIDGVTFATAWPNRLTLTIPVGTELVAVPMISLTDLIANKEASGRPKDLEDLNFLRRARNPRP
jgi:hypothetical protein